SGRFVASGGQPDGSGESSVTPGKKRRGWPEGRYQHEYAGLAGVCPDWAGRIHLIRFGGSRPVRSVRVRSARHAQVLSGMRYGANAKDEGRSLKCLILTFDRFWRL